MGDCILQKGCQWEGIESDAKGSVGMAIAYSNINANNEWDAGDARLRPIRPPMRREASRQAAKRYAERQSKIKENGYAGQHQSKAPSFLKPKMNRLPCR